MMIATAALLAAPALAQTAAPQPAPAEAPRHGGLARGPMFANISPEGRKILRDAMVHSQEDRTSVRAARDRINALVGAEKLDVAALKRAMDAERQLVDGQHAKRQASMLAAIQKLSAEDRKAFAADARKARADVEARTAEWRKRSEKHRRAPGAVPPPPPPPASPGGI
nr:periplasmic heavy metal sensor [Sandaracinobacteroides sayramensis]